jgi:aspartate-semialdehyde dehydrogenase
MKPVKEGYRVAVVGASSLLGKELLTVLDEQAFPVSRLVTFEGDEEEPELPIVDLREESHAVIEDREVSESELDFAFLAVRPRPLPAFLISALRPACLPDEWPAGAGRPSAVASDTDGAVGSRRQAAESLRPGGGKGERGPAIRQPTHAGRGHCFVIDLTGEGLGEGRASALAEGGAEPLAPVSPRVSVPFLDRRFPARGPVRQLTDLEPDASAFLVSAHPAVIMLSSLLLRLAARFRLERAVAQVFVSASEIGPRAIEELQKQTVGLLSFQKIPHKVFGAQLAFNLLARLGKSGEPRLTDLESRLREQLRQYLGGRVPLPALRLVQAPVFYSMALSLYVESAQPLAAEEAAAALAGERLRVRRSSQDAPTPVEVVGSNDILVDAVTTDAAHPTGIWLWAVADNLRLAAINAVEIAQSLRARARTQRNAEL